MWCTGGVGLRIGLLVAVVAALPVAAVSTAQPGYALSSGAGTATDATKRQPEGGKSLYLAPGDVVEVSSPRIGTLRNRIVAKG